MRQNGHQLQILCGDNTVKQESPTSLLCVKRVLPYFKTLYHMVVHFHMVQIFMDFLRCSYCVNYIFSSTLSHQGPANMWCLSNWIVLRKGKKKSSWIPKPHLTLKNNHLQARNQGGSRGLDEPPILTSFLLKPAVCINTQ